MKPPISDPCPAALETQHGIPYRLEAAIQIRSAPPQRLPITPGCFGERRRRVLARGTGEFLHKNPRNCGSSVFRHHSRQRESYWRERWRLAPIPLSAPDRPRPAASYGRFRIGAFLAGNADCGEGCCSHIAVVVERARQRDKWHGCGRLPEPCRAAVCVGSSGLFASLATRRAVWKVCGGWRMPFRWGPSDAHTRSERIAIGGREGR